MNELDGFIVFRKNGEAIPVLVSRGDFWRVWQAGPWSLKTGKGTYLQRATRRRGRPSTQLLHRFILQITAPDLFVDHINGDTFDNRQENLRVVTLAEQNQNRKERKPGRSKYRGVSLERCGWRAKVQCDGKQYHLGFFGDEKEAARAAAKARNRLFTHNNEARHPIED